MYHNRLRVSLLAVCAVLLAAALACNAPVSSPAATAQLPSAAASATPLQAAQADAAVGSPSPLPATATLTQLATATFTQTPTVTLTATATLIPSATLTPTIACTLGATFVTDVTIPDNTVLRAGKPFQKTWRVQNTGNCAWETGTQLVYISGEAMGGPSAVGVAAIAPGATTDVSVNFVAPASEGTYRSFWQMRTPGGVLYGSQMYVQIVVPGPTEASNNSSNGSQQSQSSQGSSWGMYRKGSQGTGVYALQYLLVAHGYSLAVDGKFGAKTDEAVRKFQDNKGLKVDGIVGDQTWSALIQGQTVRKGSAGAATKAVQHVLKNGYGFSLTVDGKFGTKTEEAVRKFQHDKGLKVDGVVGANTWKALISGL